MEPVTIVLSQPVQAHGEQVDELVLSAPTARIFRVLDESKGNVDSIFRMISAMAGVPISAVEMLAPEDFGRCARVVADFLGPLAPSEPAS